MIFWEVRFRLRCNSRKIGLEMNVALYAQLSRLAKANGQSRRFLLEKALEHYLREVVPSQATIRPETMKPLQQSVKKNRRLYQLLAT